jgi:hypothetical protein
MKNSSRGRVVQSCAPALLRIHGRQRGRARVAGRTQAPRQAAGRDEVEVLLRGAKSAPPSAGGTSRCREGRATAGSTVRGDSLYSANQLAAVCLCTPLLLSSPPCSGRPAGPPDVRSSPTEVLFPIFNSKVYGTEFA